jgi:hypothetical protein
MVAALIIFAVLGLFVAGAVLGGTSEWRKPGWRHDRHGRRYYDSGSGQPEHRITKDPDL